MNRLAAAASQHLALPYPPTVNHYWLPNARGGKRLTTRGKQFRHDVFFLCKQAGVQRLEGFLELRIHLAPPDHRVRDADNVIKPLFDALQHGGLYNNDSQVKRHTVEFGPPEPNSGTLVIARVLPGDQVTSEQFKQEHGIS